MAPFRLGSGAIEEFRTAWLGAAGAGLWSSGMSRRFTYPGACHCRNIELVLESDHTPGELGVRTDTCSFCQKHHAVYASDPGGDVHLIFRDADLVERYRFGTKTADFLSCKACGVFVAAYMAEPPLAVVNVNVLDARAAFLANEVQVADFEGESVEQRLARRRARWTPVRSAGER
jgi:hypothetical protein